MNKGAYLATLLRSNKTIFSFKDIVLLWGDSGSAAKARINYYVKKGALYPLRRGIYAKDKNYNNFELATKIFTPSYVSFETILAREGMIFQFYSSIFVASYLTREIVCDDQVYSFKKIKGMVLSNGLDIENKNECSIATKERAFLDTIYLNKDYHFDNLAPLNWDKVFKILPIYNNKRMTKRAEFFYKYFKNNQ